MIFWGRIEKRGCGGVEIGVRGKGDGKGRGRGARVSMQVLFGRKEAEVVSECLPSPFHKWLFIHA